MKNILFLALCLFALTACQDDDDGNRPGARSSWELAFVLADPGNGSGVFTPVDSDRTLDLLDEGSWVANENLCTFGTTDEQASTGVYSLEDGTFTVDDCVTTGGSPFSIEVRGDTLDLTYLCIEACAHRYLRR